MLIVISHFIAKLQQELNDEKDERGKAEKLCRTLCTKLLFFCVGVWVLSCDVKEGVSKVGVPCEVESEAEKLFLLLLKLMNSVDWCNLCFNNS